MLTVDDVAGRSPALVAFTSPFVLILSRIVRLYLILLMSVMVYSCYARQ